MLEVANIFSDRMVLQREKEVAVWGYAEPGEMVSVSIQGKCEKTKVKQDGSWNIFLPPLKASENEMLLIQTKDDIRRFVDVAIGEVWIAGGQSNMEFPICYEKYYREEKDICNRNLRFFDVPEICYEEQRRAYDYSKVGIWREAYGEDLKYFSAVGYYFQKELIEQLSVPVGIIGCNWGGTCSCAWMDEKTVKQVGEPWIARYESAMQGYDVKSYWDKQYLNPANNTGNPCMDPFSAFVLPQTRSMEEMIGWFMEMAGVSDAPDTVDINKNMMEFSAMIEPKAKPGCLFEYMVRPIAPFTVRGGLWYQGESDDIPGLQGLYQSMLTGLIKDWRMAWQDMTLPFLLIQLPGYKAWMQINNNDFVTIRNCQEKVADHVPNVYLASISDVGEEYDIHPKNKKIVGHRLALLARKYIWGKSPVRGTSCRESRAPGKPDCC